MDDSPHNSNDDDRWPILNDAAAWAWVLSTNATETCGEAIKRFYSRKTCRFTTSPFRCKAVICEECAPSIIRRYLQHFANVWEGQSKIWFASFYPASRELLDRITQRRRRTLGEYALFIPKYGAFHHRAFIFSNADLSGRKQPTEGQWVDVQTALSHLRLAFCVPGLAARPRSISMGWKMEQQRKPPSDSAYVGQVRAEVWYPALRLLDVRIERTYGERTVDNQKPSAVPDDVWLAMLRQAIADIRAQRGDPDEEVVSDDP